VRLALDAHALADFGLDALAAAVFGHQDGAFIVRLQAGRAERVGGEAPRKAQDLRRVAIVDLQHRRAALGLDTELAPDRPCAPLVDRLHVVVDDHQRSLVGIDILAASASHSGSKSCASSISTPAYCPPGM
jgi:hypothetical protein